MLRKWLFFTLFFSLNGTLIEAGKTPITEEHEVVIVGGGLAGLTTAYRLTQAEKEAVVLFEARDRLGGRVHTFHDGKGYRELGGQDIDNDHEEIQELAQELGCTLIPHPLSKTLHYFYGEEEQSYKNLLKSAEKLLLKVLDYQLQTKNEDEGRSLWDVLTHLFPEDEKMRDLALIIQGNIGLDPERMHPNLLGWINIEFQKNIQYLKLLMDPDSVNKIKNINNDMHIEGGNKVLIDKLAERIGESQIRTQHVLKKVKKTTKKNGEDFFILSFQKDGKKHKVSAERVVMAMPFSVLKNDVKLDSSLGLPKLTEKAILELPYATYAKVTIPTNMFWGNPKEETFLFFDGKERIEVSDYSFNQEHPGITVYFSGTAGVKNFTNANTIKPDVLKALITSFSKKIPGFQVDETRPVVSYAPALDPFALGSWVAECFDTDPIFYPKTRLNKNKFQHYAQPFGNFYFAGEHTVNNFPGSMNGAVISGDLVSELILDKNDVVQ